MSEPGVFYCQLCANLKTAPDIVFIKKDEGIKRKIYEKVIECFHLENSFPSSVCPDCWVQATSMYDLYKKVLRAQDILRNINPANIQLKPDSAEHSNIKVEIEEGTADSVNLKHEIEFGKENHSDLENKNDDWSDCKNDIDIEDGDDAEWNQPLSVIKKEAVVKDEKTHRKKKIVNKSSKGCKKEYKLLKAEEWKDYIFYCTLCAKQFKKVQELRKHFENKHETPVEYKCMDCEKISTQFPLFRRHVKTHRAKFKFWCKPCNKYFQMNHKYQRHMRFVHGPDGSQRALCPICGKSFKASYLEKHKRFVHLPDAEKYQFECDICHKKVTSYQNLKTHQKVHEDIREHTCEHCGVAFKQQASLNIHIISKHTDLKDSDMIKCPDCPMKFKHALRLKRHQVIHMETELYHCEVCARAFKHKRALNRHASIHTNLLPFECEYCKKCFRQKSFLKIHLRQHTGEKPYSCTECNQHFTNDSNFMKHIRGRHGLQQFSIKNQNQYPFVNK